MRGIEVGENAGRPLETQAVSHQGDSPQTPEIHTDCRGGGGHHRQGNVPGEQRAESRLGPRTSWGDGILSRTWDWRHAVGLKITHDFPFPLSEIWVESEQKSSSVSRAETGWNFQKEFY